MKTKLKGRVWVVQDGYNEVIMGDDVFQLDELVDPYCVAENIFVDVDVEELNDILRTSKDKEVNEDDDSDNDKINIEDCDEDDDDEDEIEEKKTILINVHSTNV